MGLTASASSVVYAQPVTFTATVPPGATGQVIFYVYPQAPSQLGSSTVSNCVAQVTETFPPLGTLPIFASYSGDANFPAANSDPVIIIVSPGETVTALSLQANYCTWVVGQGIPCIANVQVLPPSNSTPSGNVEFLLDGVVAATAISSGGLSPNGGQATAGLTNVPLGQHTVMARYISNPDTEGVAVLQTSVSATAVIRVVLQPTTTTVVSIPTVAQWGQTVTFSANVSGGNTGSVSFLDGSTPLGTVALNGGQAAVSTSALAVRNHSIVANYSGDSFSAGSTGMTTVEIDPAQTFTTVSSISGVIKPGDSLVVNVKVQSDAGQVTSGSVQILDNGVPVGSAPLVAGSATATIANLVTGSHVIVASFGGVGNFAPSMSSAIPVLVQSPAVPTTTIVVSPRDSAVFQFGQPVTVSVRVAATDPQAGVPGGTVDFLDNRAAVSTAGLSGGMASATLSNLAVGTHVVTASYSGGPTFSASAATVALTISKPQTSLTLLISPTTPVLGSAVVLTAQLTATAEPVCPHQPRVLSGFWMEPRCWGQWR